MPGQPIRIDWVKVMYTVMGLAFAVGMAWALVKGDIRANKESICVVQENIIDLEETDKEIISQMNETEVILRGIETDIEWIRSTMENGQ